MPDVIVVGGGLAGLAAAAALGGAGFDVEIHEARGFLGGRATSFPVSPSEESSEVIDNCQRRLAVYDEAVKKAQQKSKKGK